MANQKGTDKLAISDEHQQMHDQLATALAPYHATLQEIARVEEECRQRRAIVAAVAAQELGKRAESLRFAAATDTHATAALCW